MGLVDAVVIGAGPAGATAAHRLASPGMKVVLIDQAVFPRSKTCGDLVTRAGLSCLARSGLRDWASAFPAIRRIRFSSPDKKTLDVDLSTAEGGCAGKILARLQLDYQLVQAAVGAGVTLMDGCRVDAVDPSDGKRIRVCTIKGDIDARILILADGSRAPITRKLGLIKTDFDLWAVQQYLEGDPEPDGPIEFHFSANILPGYAWLIPMGDGKINVGAGTYTSRVRKKEIDLTEILEQFKKQHPTSPGRLDGCVETSSIHAHPLRTYLNTTRTHAERLLVAGDAAGLVSPFTGEGIAAAMVSGELAAQFAQTAVNTGNFSADQLAPYTHALRRRFEQDKKVARLLRSVLRYPALLDRIMGRMGAVPELGQLFGQVFMDEKSPRELIKPGTLMRLLFQ